MQSAATDIKWQGQIYHVAWSSINTCIIVAVIPENDELAEIIKRDIEQDPFHTLPVAYGWGFRYLLSDADLGESRPPPA